MPPEKIPKLPTPPPEIRFTEKDATKLFILFCGGVLGIIYGFGKIIEGIYKTFQKLIITTPQNVAKLTQSTLNREQNPYPLSFLFKSLPSFKKPNSSTDKHDQLSVMRVYNH